jgi:hypothetical protein
MVKTKLIDGAGCWIHGHKLLREELRDAVLDQCNALEVDISVYQPLHMQFLQCLELPIYIK